MKTTHTTSALLTMSSPILDEKNLGEEVQLEVLDNNDGHMIGGDDGVRKSAFDGLGWWQTIKTFRRAVLYCLAVYTMSMLDGWAVSTSTSGMTMLTFMQPGTGALVVNKGFVAKFGTRKGQSGVLALDPTWLSVWACQYVSVSRHFDLAHADLTTERRAIHLSTNSTLPSQPIRAKVLLLLLIRSLLCGEWRKLGTC
jgi:hypothetical protein